MSTRISELLGLIAPKRRRVSVRFGDDESSVEDWFEKEAKE
jgi:hypothetical protein